MEIIDWVSRINNDIQKEYSLHKRVLSYEEYLVLVEKYPGRQLRSSAQYIANMMEHFGCDEDGHFKLFDQSFVDDRFKRFDR